MKVFSTPLGRITSSLTVRPGFGELLPDNVREMNRKLKGFGSTYVDEQTGAIVANEKPAGVDMVRTEVL
jgi:hypothetical protein